MPFVGSGPFRVAELQKSKWVKLEANPDYPEELGGPPTLDEVYFVISQNTDSMIEDYKAGGLDAIVDFPATYEKVLAELPGTTTVAAPAVGFHELGFNCWKSPKSKGNPLLRDPVIRQAVHWAIDKQKIVATSMAGLAEPGTSLISTAQGDWHWEVPEAGQYRYDPARAKQMLEDAGYADGDGDGVRETAAGDKLSFRLVALNEYPEDQAAAKMIVSWCRDVGIELRLDQKDEGAFSDEVYDNADYDMFIWSWGGDIDPGFMLSTFTTRQIRSWGDSQYSNPEYDRLYVAPGAGVRPGRPRGHRAAQGDHRRDAEDPVPGQPLHRPLVQPEPAGVPHGRLAGVRVCAGGGGRAVLELHARHLHQPAPPEDRPVGDRRIPPRGRGGRAPRPPPWS